MGIFGFIKRAVNYVTRPIGSAISTAIRTVGNVADKIPVVKNIKHGIEKGLDIIQEIPLAKELISNIPIVGKYLAKGIDKTQQARSKIQQMRHMDSSLKDIVQQKIKGKVLSSPSSKPIGLRELYGKNYST